MPYRVLHPLFRHLNIILCLSGAAATVVVSWLTNPHSAPWLVDIYVSVILLLATLRNFKKSPLHRSFALYLSALILYLINVWILHVLIPGRPPEAIKSQINPLVKIVGLGSVYMAVALYHFTLRFAQARSGILRVIEYCGWAANTVFYALLLHGSLMGDNVWAGFTWVPVMNSAYKAFFYLTTIFVTLGIAIPLFSVFTATDRQRRLQLFYFLLGGAPLWLSCWGHFLISLGINIYPAGGVIFLLHALILSYAVLKHQVFDITILIRRGLAYAALSLFIGILYGGLLLILSTWTAAFHASLISSVIFVFMVGMIYAPLLSYLQRLFDRLLFRQAFDRQKMIEQFARESAESIDLNSLTHSLCTLIAQSLDPRGIRVFMDTGNDTCVQFCSYSDGKYFSSNWPEGPQFPERFTHDKFTPQGAYRIHFSAPKTVGQSLQLTEGDDALVVPITHRQRQLGYLILEPKRADDPYSDDDIRMAETIAAQSATALQNARSFAQMENLQDFTRTMLQSLTTGVLVVSSTGAIEQSNQAACSICALDASFPANLNELEKSHPELVREIRVLLQDGKSSDDIEVRTAGSRPRNLLLSFRRMGQRDADALFLVVIHDVTNYKELEAEALRRESLARIGEATAGINHEIKNLLHPIRRQMDRLARVDVNDSAAVKHELERANSVIPGQVQSLERMLLNLKTLGRPLVLRCGPVDLESMVAAVWQEVLATVSPREIAFATQFSNEAREVIADGAWLRHVLHNLLMNAAEATSGRTPALVSVKSERDGQVFKLSISDNGSGIDDASKGRLFEPFFSTKGEAGTGLGLCVCRRIIESHGGRIVMQSINGQTIFSVILPAQQKLAAGETHQNDPRRLVLN